MTVNFKKTVENRACALLSNEENNQLFKLLGNRCQSLASAVVQLYTTDGPNHNKWIQRHCGVACFVKDNSRRSYYIRIYDLSRGAMVWEQELYTQFRFRKSSPRFYTFEADACQTGLNFADDSEFEWFCQVTVEKVSRAGTTRRATRRRHPTVPQNNGINGPAVPTVTNVVVPSVTTTSNKDIFSNSHKKPGKDKHKGKKDNKKAPINKNDIGLPTGFRCE